MLQSASDVIGATTRKAHSSLLDMLVRAQLLTKEQSQHVLQGQGRGESGGVINILLTERLVEPEQLALVASLHLGTAFVDLTKQEAEGKALELLPEWICRKYRAIPIKMTDGGLQVAIEDPSDIQTLDDLAALTKRRIEPLLAFPDDIQDTIDRSYRIGGEIATQLQQMSPVGARGDDAAAADAAAEAIAEAPMVRAVDLLIRQAARDRASDIHIEPDENEVRVRFRIDGILHEGMSLPKNVHPALTSRIKITAGMNIAETRRPQDGQLTMNDGERELDIRVATAPTVNGEMVVMRILDKTFAFLDLPELGFLTETLEAYQNLLKLPHGMILSSGPTGAGKTTTLYGSVNQLDKIGRNIITIEDPVEYRFGNINQIQVNAAAGVTFASGLRATMRLDPNIILVGEIRDSETAQVAVQAALTGHLVLSTVHANDTAGVMSRLIDLGVEPFLLASGVVGVVAQRMVRRICPNCSTPAPVATDERQAYESEMNEEKELFLSGVGCNYCAQTGYLGRTGIFEVMVVGETIRRQILTGANIDDIRAAAASAGMTSLWHDGMIKVKMGLTTPQEVIRNVHSIG